MTAFLTPWSMLGSIVALGFVAGVIFGSLPRDHASGARSLRLPAILASTAIALLAIDEVWGATWLHGRTAWRVELGLALLAAYGLGTVLVRTIQSRTRQGG